MIEGIKPATREFRRSPLMHHPDEQNSGDKWAGVPAGAGTAESSRQPGEVLTKQRIGQLASGLFNSEMKLITLGGMILFPGLYSKVDLDHQHRELQQGHDGWILSNTKPYEYCEKSFVHVSLVVQDEIIEDRMELGYRVTPDGVATLAAIGHLLTLSERHPEFSLQQLLSETQTGGIQRRKGGKAPSDISRAPANRLELFRALLASSEPTRFTDLMDQAGLDYGSPHIQNLAIDGFLEYKRPKFDTAYALYTPLLDRFVPEILESIPPFGTNKKLLRHVTEIVRQEGRPFSAKEVKELLLDQFPEYQAREQKSLGSSVNNILSHLARHGLMERQNPDQDRYSRAFVSLTDPQRAVLTEFMEIIDGFQEGTAEYLREGEEKARAILGDPERVAAITKKTGKYSKARNAIKREILDGIVLDLVDEKGSEGVTSHDVTEAVGYRIGITHAGNVLRRIEGLKKVRDGRQYRYFRAESDEQEVGEESSPVVSTGETRVYTDPAKRAELEDKLEAIKARMGPTEVQVTKLQREYDGIADKRSPYAKRVARRITGLKGPLYRGQEAQRAALEAKLAELDEPEGENSSGVSTLEVSTPTVSAQADTLEDGDVFIGGSSDVSKGGIVFERTTLDENGSREDRSGPEIDEL